MKKVTIGVSLFAMGIIQTVGIILSAAIYLPNARAWSTMYPSKLFFLIFAGYSKYNDGLDGLGLGVFFVFGIILTVLGLVILGTEYFKKESK